MKEMGRKTSAGFLCKGLIVAGLLLGLFSSISLAAETTTYYIRAGDTLSSVAAAHDITLTELLDLNPEIADSNKVYIGTAIQVPAPETQEGGSAVAQCPQPYIVVVGDTWESIARENRVEADILALVNSMTVTDNLAAGTEICIPGSPPTPGNSGAGTFSRFYAAECPGEVWVYDDFDNEKLFQESHSSAETSLLQWGTYVCHLATESRASGIWMQVQTEDGRTGWVKEQSLFLEDEYRARVQDRIAVIPMQIEDHRDTVDNLEEILSFSAECTDEIQIFNDLENEKLHAKPSRFSATSFLQSGTPLCPIATRSRLLNTWIQVQVADGRTGWVKEPSLLSGKEYLAEVKDHIEALSQQIKEFQNALNRLLDVQAHFDLEPEESPAVDLAPTPVPTQIVPVTPVPMPTARGEGVHMDILEVLVVSPHLQGITYDRDDWQHWTDADGDCQNARAEVLIEESLAPVTFRANNPCIVHSGLWTGPWGREQFVLASDLDIDHHVPLFNAHLSGGATWSAGEKRAYANDLSLAAALQATKASYNRQKGGRGPEEWKPPLRATWCTYAQGWIDVKYKYSLTVTVPEKAALQDMLSTCDGSTPATAVQPVVPTPPSSLPAPGAGEGFWYTIGRGDSLGRIASRHDCPLDVLVAVNQISNPSIIRLGDRLWIPTHCAVLDSRASAWAPPPTATPALPLPTSTPTRTPVPAQPPASTPTPVPPAPTATQIPVPPTPTYTPVPLPVSQTGYQCTVNPYNPPPLPQNPRRTCKWFDDNGWTRAEFDQYYGGSFYPSHDRDHDCIPCESLN